MQSFLIPEKNITRYHHSVVYQNKAQCIFYRKHIRFLPLCATLEDISNFLMLCTGFTQTFSRKCRNYRLRVIQTLISRGVSWVGWLSRLNDTLEVREVAGSSPAASRGFLDFPGRIRYHEEFFNFTMEWMLNFTPPSGESV